VLEEVGRGGMGRVWRAYDPMLTREVALKQVHAQRPSLGSTRSLLREARAMARLSHPNVVEVYDVEELPGTAVVLVMEYVAGETLSQWIRRCNPDSAAILDRFIAAGRGLAAAHAAGLLHRDFKPGNVMVGTDEVGLVKVTDFGLAKASPPSAVAVAPHASDSDGDETEEGLAVGTPRYMAPEQHRGQALTPAADQFAFCVALWEALTGTLPFAGPDIGHAKHRGPPRWPVASTPSRVVAAVTRGLAARPRDRWPSMRALLDALEGHRGSRTRPLWGLGTLGVLAAAGIAWDAAAVTEPERCSGAQQRMDAIWGATARQRVHEAILAIDRPYADDVASRTRHKLDAYAQEWTHMHRDACEAASVRGEQSPKTMDLRMACLERAAGQLEAAVETLEAADEATVQNAHRIVAGLDPLEGCADVETLAAGRSSPKPRDASAVDVARAGLDRAKSLDRAGRYGAALRRLRDVESMLTEVDYAPIRAEVGRWRGSVLRSLGRYEESQAALDEALRGALRGRDRETIVQTASELMHLLADARGRPQIGARYWPLAQATGQRDPQLEATARTSRAMVFQALGDYPAAERENRRALELRRRGSDPLEVANARNNLAVTLELRGKYVEAEREHRAVLADREKELGPGHPLVAGSHGNLGSVLHHQGKLAESESHHRMALEINDKAFGPEHPDVIGARNNLAAVLAAQGKFAEAHEEFRAVLDAAIEVYGPDHPMIASYRNNLASSLIMAGNFVEAEPVARVALRERIEALGPDHPDVATSHNNLGSMLLRLGKRSEAEAQLRAALTIWRRALGDDHPNVSTARNNLGVLLHRWGRNAEAIVEHRAALAARIRTLGPDHPQVAESRRNLERVRVDQQRREEAEPLAP
jgi:serine/threonine-protein kinase